jgi:hypothetical protein
VSVGAARPSEPDDVPLSDAEWEALAALQTELDLGSGGRDAPEGRFVGFIRRVVVWLWWLLDPKAEGLPMPPLLDPERRRRRRGTLGTGRPAGA